MFGDDEGPPIRAGELAAATSSPDFAVAAHRICARQHTADQAVEAIGTAVAVSSVDQDVFGAGSPNTLADLPDFQSTLLELRDCHYERITGDHIARGGEQAFQEDARYTRAP